MFKSRVQFGDGDVIEGDHHKGSPGQSLSDAVRHAEQAKGQDHSGAWVEHAADPEPPERTR